MLEWILGCGLVASSSLHGLIFAEAFGVPARWLALRHGGSEPTLKFYDYFLGTGRSNIEPATSLAHAMRLGPQVPIPDALAGALAAGLYRAFPFELFGLSVAPHLASFEQPIGVRRGCAQASPENCTRPVS